MAQRLDVDGAEFLERGPEVPDSPSGPSPVQLEAGELEPYTQAMSGFGAHAEASGGYGRGRTFQSGLGCGLMRER